jgi:hypothetical protein
MALRLTLGTLQIQLEHWFCHRQLSHNTQSRTIFLFIICLRNSPLLHWCIIFATRSCNVGRKSGKWLIIRTNETSIEIEIRSNLTTLFMPSIRFIRRSQLSWSCNQTNTYRNGPKTYPWNTPDSIGTLILSPSIITLHPISYHFFISHMS